MSEEMTLICNDCHAENSISDLDEEKVPDGPAISRSLCPECEGRKFTKAAPKEVAQ